MYNNCFPWHWQFVQLCPKISNKQFAVTPFLTFLVASLIGEVLNLWSRKLVSTTTISSSISILFTLMCFVSDQGILFHASMGPNHTGFKPPTWDYSSYSMALTISLYIKFDHGEASSGKKTCNNLLCNTKTW